VAPDAVGHAHLVLEALQLAVGSSARRLVLIESLTEGLTRMIWLQRSSLRTSLRALLGTLLTLIISL
jgi:hypothetical protein